MAQMYLLLPESTKEEYFTCMDNAFRIGCFHQRIGGMQCMKSYSNISHSNLSSNINIYIYIDVRTEIGMAQMYLLLPESTKEEYFTCMDNAFRIGCFHQRIGGMQCMKSYSNIIALKLLTGQIL